MFHGCSELFLVYRFMKLLRSNTKNFEPVLSSEHERALFSLANVAQNQDFAHGISKIRNGTLIPSQPSLLKLSVFLNNESLVAVGGRLNNSELPHVTDNFIVLSNDSHFSYLLVKNAHHQTLHGLIELTIAQLCDLVRKVLHNCVVRLRKAKQKKTTLMGDLPLKHVKPSKPFTLAAVDFAGAFKLRISNAQTKPKKYVFAHWLASPRKQFTSKLSLRSRCLTFFLVFAVSSLDAAFRKRFRPTTERTL